VDDPQDVYKAHPTRDEIAEVLDQRLTATVGTLNEDGSIHLAYVIFLHVERRLYFETASSTRKARNADHRGSTSMLVQGHASSGRSLMVAAEGQARVIRGPSAHEINHQLRAKYLKPDVLASIDRVWGSFDDVAIEITPHRWRSWTATPFHDATQAALDIPYESAWRTD
jgi:hypothetical protein